MDTVIETNNPFGIDCQNCDKRYDLFNMTITDDSKTLCGDCILDYRVTQFMKHSNLVFG